jgi:AcrR family transcriptional regulator
MLGLTDRRSILGKRGGVMARTVKQPAVRRGEILDAAERLLLSKGYEGMAINDLIDELGIAKGTVYHYFDSKHALLEALAERMVEEVEQRAGPVAADPQVPACEKLVAYFAATDQWKLSHRGLVMELLRIWQDDQNAIVHRKLARAGVRRFGPMLSAIISQGIGEGVFHTPYPAEAARMVLALRDDLGTAVGDLYLSANATDPRLGEIAHMAEATMDAVERVLGASRGSLQQAWPDALRRWQGADKPST